MDLASHQRLGTALRSKLPQGGELPAEEWERRHRALTQLLLATAVVIAAYSALQDYALWHTALDTSAVVAAGVLAVRTGVGRRVRALACSFGLLSGAAMGVHVSGGVTEAHFSFFVVVVLLTLYEDWLVFVLAVLYTLIHHGVLGMLAPGDVFAAHLERPWQWAAVHAVFVAAAGAAGVVAWRLNEDVRRRMQETQDELRAAAITDSLTGLPNRRRLTSDLEIAAEDPEARLAVRPRRLQGLQRHLRASGRRCPADPSRSPPARGRQPGRNGLPPRRRRVLRARLRRAERGHDRSSRRGAH